TTTIFMFDTFRLSFQLLNTFIEHTSWIYSIDYLTSGNNQFICSGLDDKTVRVWDIENNKRIKLFNGHSDAMCCVTFSSYHYNINHCQNVICSSSWDITIRFWDIKDN
ncbi:hypothetical protein RFI_30127, partial [Reticulomyxa filosa]